MSTIRTTLAGAVASTGVPPQRRRAASSWAVRQGRWGYAMVAASVLGLGLFQLAPLFWAMAESTQRFNPITHKPLGFVGLANFQQVMSDPAFWQALANTAIYCVATTVIELSLGLAIAMLLDRSVPGTPVARTAVIAALALSESVTALVWFTMMDTETGMINGLLGMIGIPAVPWLTSTQFSLLSVIIVAVWHNVGLVVLIYLAGLQGLDDELYNAAAVDGASPVRQFWHLTLPLLQRTTTLAVFLVTIHSIRIFTPILIMTMGGPENSSMNLVFYIYAQGVENLDYGVGSAATVCLILVLILVTSAQSLFTRRSSR